MPTTLEFLEAILPPSGLYCAAVFDPDDVSYRRQEFHATTLALSEQISRLDKGCEGTRRAVYHGCASYTGRSRTKDAVALVRSLWLDIDCGPKGYADQSAAMAALELFVKRWGLPVPIVVGSGSGLHVYWPFEHAVTRDVWERYALGLKRLCDAGGLRAGRERTADCASILRPPGAIHRKMDPRPVVCGPLRGPYPLEAFNVLLGGLPSPVSRVALGNRHAQPLANRRRGLLEKAGNTYAPEPIDFEALCRGCAQIRSFRDERGDIPEPLWYAGLGVLGFAAGGDEIAQEWSSGHPTYQAEETAARLSRARRLSGPTTCSHFSSLSPDLCKGCRFGKTTPLEAARELRKTPEPVELGVNPPSVRQPDPSIDGPPQDGPIEGTEFSYEAGAVVKHYENTKGDPKKTLVTNYPFQIVSVHTGEIKNDQHHYLMRHYKPHVGWRELDMKASALHGVTLIPTLADVGVVIHEPEAFKQYIRESVDHLHRQEKTRMQFEQFGWKSDNTAFLYGDTLYTHGNKTTTACSSELRHRAQWLKPVPGGSVEGWKQAVDCLFGQGSEGQSFAILASFGAVLMRFLEDNEGGAVISLVTPHSGAGKTTSLAGAYTVWASKDRGLALTTIDTKVSKTIALEALANLPVIYDEFSNKDPAIVREFMVTFTSGRDKMRGTSDGQIIHTAAGWQTMLITASNKSLIDTIMSTGESDAPAFRILEFSVESAGELKPSEAARMKKQMEDNAGWAGDAFLNYLLQPAVLEWTRKRLGMMIDEIYTKGGFKKEHRFWVRALAATGVAASLVEHLGLIAFSPQRIMGWALTHFVSRIEGQREKDASIVTISRFLNEHIGETLTTPGPWKATNGRTEYVIGDKPKNRVSVRVEIEGERIIIAENVLREWTERRSSLGYRGLLGELKAKGVMLSDRAMMTLTAGTGIKGGQVWSVIIDGGHPALTGMLREAKTTAKDEARIRNLRTVK